MRNLLESFTSLWAAGAPDSTRPSRARLARWLGWFGTGNLLLFLLVSLRYLQVIRLPESAQAWSFAPLLFISHFSSMLFLLFAILLLPVVLVRSRRLLLFLAVALASLLLFSLLADTFVYAQYRFHINGAVLNLLFGGAAGEIFTFSWVVLAGIGLLAMAILLIELVLARLCWGWLAQPRRRAVGPWLALGLLALFFTEKFWYAWADATSNTVITAQARYLPGYQPVQAKTYFVDWGLIDAAEAATEIRISHGSTLHYPLHAMQCTPAERPLNVVYIVIDSWRFDAMNERVTPHIQQFSEAAQSFQHHYSGGNATRIGLFSLFYGLPGTYWQAMLNEERSAVLLDTLQAQGYDLGIFASAKLTSPEFDRTIFSAVEGLRTRSDGDMPHERDQDISRDFLQFLEGKSPADAQPFFGFLFYDAPHAYDFPPDYAVRFEPMWEKVNYLALDEEFDPQPFVNRYHTAVHFIDAEVGRVLERLRQRGLLEDTVVVITGDHGQEFNDNGLNYWGHNGNFTRYQAQVPLLIRWPGRGRKEFSHTTSHMDLTPTIMQEVLGCTNPSSDYSAGKSLFDTTEPPFLILGSTEEFAVKEGARMSVVSQFGTVSVLDQRYRPIEGAGHSAAMLDALELNSRFYRK